MNRSRLHKPKESRMRSPWRRPKVKPQTCRACRKIIQEERKGSLHQDGASYKAGALVWKTCSGFLQRICTKVRMRLPRTDMSKTPNWRFLRLASLNPLARMVAVAVPATTRYMAARLRQLTRYLRTQHSLNCHDETKTGTRYSLYPSRYPHQIPRACRMGRQHHALPQVACQSGVSNQSIPRANRRPRATDDTQKQAQRDDKPIKTNLLPLHTRRVQTLFYFLSQDKCWIAKKPSDLAILRSHHH
jgi:hypothetical protein